MNTPEDHFIQDLIPSGPDFLSEDFLRSYTPESYTPSQTEMRAVVIEREKAAHTRRLRRQAVRLTGLAGHKVKGDHYDSRTDAQLISIILELQNYLRDHDAKPVPVARPRKRRRAGRQAAQTVEA